MKNTYFSVLLCLLLICCGQQAAAKAVAGPTTEAAPTSSAAAEPAMEQPRTEPGPGHVQLAAQSTAAAGSPLLPAAAAAAAAKGLNDVMQQGGSATRKIMSGSSSCLNEPPDGWLPAGGAWICDTDSCTAFCLDDTLIPSDNLTVNCSAGSWTAPGLSITCDAPGCTTEPELQPNATWFCDLPVAIGTQCTAECNGTSNPANPPVAVCDSGDWVYLRGSCAEPDFCVKPPPLEWLPIGGDWECTTGRESDTCTAICLQGYDQTGSLTVNGDCYINFWSETASSITCTPSDCLGTPDPIMQPDANWSCKVPAKHGTECTGGCADGTLPADPPVAVCDFGSWVYVRGSCAGKSVKTYYFTFQGPQQYMQIMRDRIASGKALDIGNLMLQRQQSTFSLVNTQLTGFKFSLEQAWVSNSPSSMRRRLLLEQQGKDEIVVGVQLSMGEGIIAKAAEKVVDAAVNTPTAANFIVTQVVDYAKTKAPDPVLLKQMSIEVTDSVGKPLGASASADSCFAQFVPRTAVNDSASIISTEQNRTASSVTVCGGARTLSTTFTYVSSSDLTGRTTLAARIINSTTTSCRVSPPAIAGNANGTTVAVTCRRKAGGAFVTAVAYTVVLTSNFTCASQQSLAIATTTVNTVVRPRLTVSAAKQQAPICGGKAAVATFRYHLRGLQPDQDFILAARVGTNCTTKFDSQPPKANGTVAVTCSGAHKPGASVSVALNLTATAQGCGGISGSRTALVPVICCLSGSSYAKVNQATCFQHVRPGTTPGRCSKSPTTFGYFSLGPGSGKLMLAQQPGSCSDAVAVADVTVSCPLGSGNKVGFKITHSAAWKPTRRLYMLSCNAPANSTACPGNPTWISVRAKPGQQGAPEGLTTTLANGKTTMAYNVTAACSCRSVYHGIYDASSYKGVDPIQCPS